MARKPQAQQKKQTTREREEPETRGAGSTAADDVDKERRVGCRGRHLEVDVGAGGQNRAELGVLLDGAPLAGAVLEHAAADRLLLLLRPLAYCDKIYFKSG
jgi:hypothetical protein